MRVTEEEELEEERKQKDGGGGGIPNVVSGVGALSLEIRTGNCAKSITILLC